MLQPEKVATPATAEVGLASHASLAPPGVVSASRTALVFVGTVAPEASWIVTAGCVAKATPQLLPEIVAEVRSKRTLPAAEAPKGHAEIVQRLIVRLAGKAGMGRGCVGQVT